MRSIRRSLTSYGTLRAFQQQQERDASTAYIASEATENTSLLGKQSDLPDKSYSILNINDEDNKSEVSSSYSMPKKKLPTKICDCRLVGFLLLLAAGFTVAFYLVLIEYDARLKQSKFDYFTARGPKISFRLDLVQHDIWSELPLPHRGLLKHVNVGNIVITHTRTRHCDRTEICLRVLKDLQLSNNSSTELNYNFLVGGDGRTYEARGWTHESGYATVPQSTTLVIGLLGNYTTTKPEVSQLQSVISLIRESIRRKKLKTDYQLYGLRNLSISLEDGEQLFATIVDWPNYVGVLQIL